MEVSESDSSSSQNQEISITTQKIVKEIKSLEKELEEIQNSCSHLKYSIKNSPMGADNSFSLKRICDCCQLDIGYPTQEEINKWMNS